MRQIRLGGQQGLDGGARRLVQIVKAYFEGMACNLATAIKHGKETELLEGMERPLNRGTRIY
jgi:hypothetical protein